MPKRLTQQQQEQLDRLIGDNPVAQYLIKQGLPLTRQNYIDLNWLGDLPDDIDEEEAEFIGLLPD